MRRAKKAGGDLAIICLSGSVASPQMLSEPNSRGRGNHFFGALRIDGFMPADEFKKAMDEMIKLYQALPRATGVDRITLAGELEQEIEKERRSNGIPLHPAIVASLQELAKELGIEYDL